ncbi:MAG TPA: hypothetical protein VFU40_07095, partial [Gemmatimonadales bacterium]|nr:hypothetical protein [Gemmatimonadales bacterium]
LCEVCTRRLGEDAITAGQLHAELAAVLTTTPGAGQVVSGTREHGLRLNPRAVACRDDIRATLVSWALLIAEERGFHPPRDEIGAIAAYVAHSAVWLSAHPAAKDAAEELHELAHGLAWRVAYPSGAHTVTLGPCPRCHGTLTAVVRATASLLPSAITCDVWREQEEPEQPPHEWTASQWHALGRLLRRTA